MQLRSPTGGGRSGRGSEGGPWLSEWCAAAAVCWNHPLVVCHTQTAAFAAHVVVGGLLPLLQPVLSICRD